jgi:hypothetical protein
MLEFEEILRVSRLRAEGLFFPPFTGPVHESTPLNASPYLAHIQDLRDGLFLSAREQLVSKFLEAMEQLPDYAVTPIAALFGGSALSSKLEPNDLDCVVFYVSEASTNPRDEGLSAFLKRWKAAGLDMRAIPADGDPIILIKVVSFFTSLYSINLEDITSMRGLVLIDCRQST